MLLSDFIGDQGCTFPHAVDDLRVWFSSRAASFEDRFAIGEDIWGDRAGISNLCGHDGIFDKFKPFVNWNQRQLASRRQLTVWASGNANAAIFGVMDACRRAGPSRRAAPLTNQTGQGAAGSMDRRG